VAGIRVWGVGPVVIWAAAAWAGIIAGMAARADVTGVGNKVAANKAAVIGVLRKAGSNKLVVSKGTDNKVDLRATGIALVRINKVDSRVMDNKAVLLPKVTDRVTARGDKVDNNKAEASVSCPHKIRASKADLLHKVVAKVDSNRAVVSKADPLRKAAACKSIVLLRRMAVVAKVVVRAAAEVAAINHLHHHNHHLLHRKIAVRTTLSRNRTTIITRTTMAMASRMAHPPMVTRVMATEAAMEASDSY
jgi:hypothetical protein